MSILIKTKVNKVNNYSRYHRRLNLIYNTDKKPYLKLQYTVSYEADATLDLQIGGIST